MSAGASTKFRNGARLRGLPVDSDADGHQKPAWTGGIKGDQQVEIDLQRDRGGLRRSRRFLAVLASSSRSISRMKSPSFGRGWS